MNMVHPGTPPAAIASLDHLVKAFTKACRRVGQAIASRPAQPLPEDLEPARMSRTRLAEELLAPCPWFTPMDVSEAASVSIAASNGTKVQAVIVRRLAVARELLCRDLRSRLQDSPIMAAPELLVELLQLHCAGLDYEVFFVVYLNSQRRVIAIEQMFRGTLTETSVHAREVVKGAIAHQAAAVAFGHNHPHADAEPSAADKLLTQRLQHALALIDVRVLDHFIVAGSKHFSFVQRGLI